MLPGAPRARRAHFRGQPRRRSRVASAALLLAAVAAAALLFASRGGWAGAGAALGGAERRRLPPNCVEDPSLRREVGLARPALPSAAAGQRFAIVSTWPPTKCGIASYSAGLRGGLLAAGASSVDVVAVHLRSARPTQYGEEVVFKIFQDVASDYREAAALLSRRRYAAVFLQHEYGIFGGYRGEMVVPLARELAGTPLLLTLHTVERVPSPMVQHALAALLARSSAVVALSPSGCRAVEGWRGTVGMPLLAGACTAVAHGVPALPLCLKGPLKRALGYEDEFIILAGGLLSPPKGVEHVIEALRSIALFVPNALLVVAGEPHPELGRGYLAELQARVAELQVDDLVHFATRYLPQAELEALYGAADVVVCAHTSAEQTSSGTLLLAMAAGTAVVATPFAQAAELLDKGAGVLVPFNNASAIAEAVVMLATDPGLAALMRASAYQLMAERSWPAVGGAYAALGRAGGEVWRSTAPRFDGRAAAAALGGEGGGGGGALDGPLAASLVFSGPEYAEVGNGALALSTVRNVNWVDGVGPGWAPTDTYLARYRPGGWGVDALLMNGCFMSYVPEGSPKHFLRVLEDLSTRFAVLPASADAGAAIEQSWEGPLAASGVLTRVQRRLTVLPAASDAFVLDLAAEVMGDAVDYGASTWLTIGFDQLSTNPAVEWSSVTTEDSKRAHTVNAACAWPGNTLSRPRTRTFAFNGQRQGKAVSLTVTLVHSAPVEVHFTCNEDKRLQSVQFDCALHDTSVDSAQMSVRTRAEVRWAG